MDILIVEDDKFLRDLISQKLNREGFKVRTAIDGEIGMKEIGERRPALILLDLILPGIDGFEILERLRNDANLSSIPVLVLSNLGQSEDIDRARSLGAEDFMIKANFTPGEIVEKVKQVLNKKYV
ncbi:response regulator [Candidatus Giovannonibacteria bacterium]|nr:response regulator [Candidatus Giovannonibacteria bacterium]